MKNDMEAFRNDMETLRSQSMPLTSIARGVGNVAVSTERQPVNPAHTDPIYRGDDDYFTEYCRDVPHTD